LILWIRKIIALSLCIAAALMPSRVRVLFVDLIGWIIQFFYLGFRTIFEFVIRELSKAMKQTEK